MPTVIYRRVAAILRYMTKHNVELRKVPGRRGEEITNAYGRGGSMMPKTGNHR